MSLTTKILLALAAGLVAGELFAVAEVPGEGSVVALAELLGQIWVSAIRMTVIPMVVALLLVGIAGTGSLGVLGRIGSRAAVLFAVSVLVSGALATIAAWLVLDLAAIDPALRATVGDGAGASQLPGAGSPTLSEWLLALIPVNPFAAAAEGALLPLIVFTVAFAAAVTRIAGASRDALVGFFDGVAQASQVLVGWILRAAPVGVFGLTLGIAARTGLTGLFGFAYYIGLVAALCSLLVMLLYAVGSVVGGIPLRRLARALAPAQSIAFGSRSSLAALPALIRPGASDLGLPPAVVGLFLPLSVSLFRITAPVGMSVGVLFLARIYGIETGRTELITIAVMSALLSFSVPAIPGGSIIVMVPILSALEIPLEGMAVLLAIDTIPDMFRTLGNVTAHLTFGALLGSAQGTTGPVGDEAGAGRVDWDAVGAPANDTLSTF